MVELLDWTGADEDQGDVNVWEDNWDDDNVEDDFSQQLRLVLVSLTEAQLAVKAGWLLPYAELQINVWVTGKAV